MSWTNIDYLGYERVNFNTMKWTWHDSQRNPDEETRDLKREDGTWYITDDYGEFVLYETVEGENDILESYYEIWLQEQVIKVGGVA